MSNISRRRRALALGTAASVVLTLGAAPALAEVTDPPADPADVVKINIVSINDFHGRVELNAPAAGAAVLAGAVKTIRDANPNTAFVAAGDLVGASTFTSFILDDNPTIDSLNAAGLEASSVGNHEFDLGWADLRDRIIPRANWEYLGANILDPSTSEPALTPSWIKDFEGVKVGFIGAVTEDLPSLVSPDGIADIEVADIVASVNAEAAKLTDGDPANGEADFLVLLVHEGAETTDVSSITPDTEIGRIVYGVDTSISMVVSAHTHLAYNHTVDGKLVVSAGQYGEKFGLTTLEVDRESKEVVALQHEILPLLEAIPGTSPTEYRPLYEPVGEVADIVDEAAEFAKVEGRKPTGEITADLLRAKTADARENRGGESTLGNFVADVHREITNADLSFMNPGGLRADMLYAGTDPDWDPDGNVTYAEAAAVQPFANTMLTMDLTGAQVRGVLEEQWQPDGMSRPFLKLGVSSNFSYTYDPTAGRGEHILTMTLNGALLEDEDVVRVGVNNFLGAGGDNFLTFRDASNVADAGIADLQAQVEWFQRNGKASPDFKQRAVGIEVIDGPALGEAPFHAGETYTLHLSSLIMAENPIDELQIVAGGEVIQTAALDNTPVAGWDDQGQATVTFTIPRDLPVGSTVSVAAGPTVVELFTSAAPLPGPTPTQTPTETQSPTPVPTETPTATPTDGSLPNTGADSSTMGPLLGVAGVLVALGGMLMIGHLVRRRREELAAE